MAKSKAGRPQSANFEANRIKIKAMKATINPKSGEPYTFAEIGKKLKMSHAMAAYYLRKEKDCCPTCYRKLVKQ